MFDRPLRAKTPQRAFPGLSYIRWKIVNDTRMAPKSAKRFLD
jgi:hypothetical protein